MDPQTLSSIRSMLIFGGGILSSTVLKGILPQDAIVPIAGVIMAGGTATWGVMARRKSSMIASTSVLPGVHAIVADASIANSPQFRDNDKVITTGQAATMQSTVQPIETRGMHDGFVK